MALHCCRSASTRDATISGRLHFPRARRGNRGEEEGAEDEDAEGAARNTSSISTPCPPSPSPSPRLCCDRAANAVAAEPRCDLCGCGHVRARRRDRMLALPAPSRLYTGPMNASCRTSFTCVLLGAFAVVVAVAGCSSMAIATKEAFGYTK